MQFKDIESEVQKSIMSQMIHGSPYGKVVINSDHVICGVNKTICQESGYHASELYGESINIFLKEALHERHTEHLKGWFKSPKKQNLKVRELIDSEGNARNVSIKLFDITVWESNAMIQTGEVKKPLVFGCAAIVFEDE